MLKLPEQRRKRRMQEAIQKTRMPGQRRKRRMQEAIQKARMPGPGRKRMLRLPGQKLLLLMLQPAKRSPLTRSASHGRTVISTMK